jgi:hypothetical protein
LLYSGRTGIEATPSGTEIQPICLRNKDSPRPDQEQ